MTDITHSTDPTGRLDADPLTTDGIADESHGGTRPSAGDGQVPEVPRSKRIAKSVGWVAFGIACLTLFTLLKLPEDRIKNYVQGVIAAQLAPKGIAFSAERGYVSVGWGISYVMKDVTLTFPSSETPSKIDQISVTPSILPMAFGYRGGSVWVYQGDGSLHASVSMKNTQISGSLKAKAIDLGRIGLLTVAAGVRGSAMATGTASFSGDFAIPSTLAGEADLTLGKVALDQQSIMGFSVPKIQISEGRLELAADKGKATIKTFKLGKAGAPAAPAVDDIQATATGDVLLGRNWDASTLNGRVNLKFSENVTKAFVLLDALLGAGKQPDGSYTFNLSGPMTSPQFLPAGK